MVRRFDCRLEMGTRSMPFVRQWDQVERRSSTNLRYTAGTTNGLGHALPNLSQTKQGRHHAMHPVHALLEKSTINLRACRTPARSRVC